MANFSNKLPFRRIWTYFSKLYPKAKKFNLFLFLSLDVSIILLVHQRDMLKDFRH